jgi:hypothetical protein
VLRGSLVGLVLFGRLRRRKLIRKECSKATCRIVLYSVHVYLNIRLEIQDNVLSPWDLSSLCSA